MSKYIDRGEQDGTLPDAEICDLLSNDRRRETIDILLDTDADQLELRDLAGKIAARECENGEPERQHEQSVYVSLHQTHLPKLDNCDLIEYDDDRKAVALTDEDHPVIEQLTHQPNHYERVKQTAAFAGVIGVFIVSGALFGLIDLCTTVIPVYLLLSIVALYAAGIMHIL